MTDETPEEMFENLDRQMAAERECEEIRIRMLRYLLDAGISMDEPPPPDLDGLSEDEFRRAVDAYEDERERILITQVRVQFLAIKLHNSTLMASFQPESTAREMMQKTRVEAIQGLWLEGLWIEPWISLINAELPGEGPTSEDIESFTASAANMVERSLRVDDVLAQIRNGIVLLAAEHGYEIELSEMPLVVSLSLLAFNYRELSSGQPVPLPAGRRSSAVETISQANRPDHPAWKAVLDRFFPL